MIRIILFLFAIIVLIPISNSVFAELENKQIIAKSSDEEIILSLQFGENQHSRFEKTIPTLQSGSIVLGDRIMEINNAKVRIMGNSFVVHSDEFLIYAKGDGSEKYSMNCYLIGGNKLEPLKLNSIQQTIETAKLNEKPSNVELIVLVQQDTRTFWNDTYDLEVKVFDKSINSNPKFYQSLGAIDQSVINVKIKNTEGIELKHFSGKTNSKGFWDMSYFVPQNIVPGGTYIVEVNVDYLDSNNFQYFETFFVADTRDTDSSH